MTERDDVPADVRALAEEASEAIDHTTNDYNVDPIAHAIMADRAARPAPDAAVRVKLLEWAQACQEPEGWADDEFEADPRIEFVAKAIGIKGMGRHWADFHDTDANGIDQDDLKQFAKAAINAVAVYERDQAETADSLVRSALANDAPSAAAIRNSEVG